MAPRVALKTARRILVRHRGRTSPAASTDDSGVSMHMRQAFGNIREDLRRYGFAAAAHDVGWRAMNKVVDLRVLRGMTVRLQDVPDPRFFDIALERSGARRETTIHVGDLYHVDVVGARALKLASGTCTVLQ